MLEHAIEDLNSNDHVDFVRVWTTCIEQEADIALTHAKESVSAAIKNVSELNSTDLLIRLNFIRQDALSQFNSVLGMAQNKRDYETILERAKKFEDFIQSKFV